VQRQHAAVYRFSPVADGNLVHEIGGHLLLSFSVEKKSLPASVIKEFLAEDVRKYTEREGSRPGRKLVKEMKEEVIAKLAPKVFGVRKDTQIWLDPDNRWLCVNSASKGLVDQFLTDFFKGLKATSSCSK